MIKDLVASCRSYRRFHEEERIPYEELKDMVDTARITGSAANSQALKYKIICRSDFSKVQLADSDTIEVVQFVGGG